MRICEGCLDGGHTSYFRCDDCGELHRNRKRFGTTHDGDAICEDCGENYFVCSVCGDVVPNEELAGQSADDEPIGECCEDHLPKSDGDDADASEETETLPVAAE